MVTGGQIQGLSSQNLCLLIKTVQTKILFIVVAKQNHAFAFDKTQTAGKASANKNAIGIFAIQTPQHYVKWWCV